VSRDISDVVEGVTANVLKPFVGGDRVVVFNPRGPEDEEAAEQESDYINFVVMERNNGFVVLNSGVKDALLLRNGYVKCGWTKRDDITTEDYHGLSDEELALSGARRRGRDRRALGVSRSPRPDGGDDRPSWGSGAAAVAHAARRAGPSKVPDRVRGDHAGAPG
jgi:hypothetical protein